MIKVNSKFLLFNLGKEYYAIAVNDIKEIVRMTNFTPVPMSPSFIKGVINIRGRIIPLIDLRIKLGLGENKIENDNCVFIIMECTESGKSHSAAIIVDNVLEIATIMPDDINSALDLYNPYQEDFLSGIAMINDKKINILNSTGVMDTRNFETVNTL